MKQTTVLACLAALLVAAAPARPAPLRAPAPMSKNAHALFDESMGLLDASYDPTAHLVFRPGPPAGEHGGSNHYMVRESSWYAFGLLTRNAPGDRDRAVALLNTVLQNQYLDPGKKWYGTFKRSPEEPEPIVGAIAFTTYDPNWRHFIGTTFEMILADYPSALPAELNTRLYQSIDKAVDGEIHDTRLVPSYSNIALMYGALWDFAATHDHRADWKTQSAAWTEEVYRLFKLHNTFYEYNSPTYCGVDLYGLALWRTYGSTPRLRTMGSDMEANLWTDLADFYQPSLRNLSGPYDRSYGMDMESYVAVVGVWLRSVMDPAKAPLPENPTLQTDHVADEWFGPQIAFLGAKIPPAAMAKFNHFSGPHLISRRIDEKRVATAWIGDKVIWGGEATSLTLDTGRTQIHPATAQWRMPSGKIGWIQLTRSPTIDAVADRTGLTITTQGDVTFRIFTSTADAPIATTAWTLPGLSASITTDAADSTTTPLANATMITYHGVKSMRLNFTLTK